MKVYARQVPPEHQESFLFNIVDREVQFNIDPYNEYVTLAGNTHYCDHMTDVFKRVWRVLEKGDLASVLEDLRSSVYDTATEAIYDYLWPEGDRKYSTRAIHAIRQLVQDYPTCKRTEEDNILCKVLSIVTGEHYECQCIRGSSQGDWQYIYYSTEHISQWDIKYIEACYFNEGSEWIIHDEEDEPETPEDISGYSTYCIGFGEDAIRIELAETAGCKPEDVVMFAYSHSISVPVYRVA